MKIDKSTCDIILAVILADREDTGLHICISGVSPSDRGWFLSDNGVLKYEPDPQSEEGGHIQTRISLDQFLSEVGSNEVEFFFTEGHDNSRKTIFVDAIKKAQQSYAKEPGPLTQAKAVP
ncbi:MAG TPA: hypothetical protein VND41_00020 [Nitrososphaerales archaeon]|nr:hypothetical protein [Nitrososphaerales archaeon]